MLELHKRVPREIKKNLRWRFFILQKSRNDPAVQRALWLVCANDIMFYINTFIYQTNPNADDDKKSAGPFITWPFQERAILSEDPDEPGILWCIDNRKSLVVEKSREMGATWWALIVRDWKCRFTKYYESLMMSKSANAVDDQTRQSLFGKLRFIHEHLPVWIHDPKKFVDNKQAFTYPGSQGTMKGFASTGKAGVSERGRDFMIDEFAQIDDAFEVLYRTSDTSKCRIFISTHLGAGTAFHSLTTNRHFKKIVFHWTQHPEKNRGMYRWKVREKRMEWLKYNEKTDELEIVKGPHDYQFPGDYDFDKTGEPVGGPHPGIRSPAYDAAYHAKGENKSEMAKDWDINPSGSVSQFYNSLVIQQLIDQTTRKPIWECNLEYDEKTGIPVKLIPAEGGLIKLWCNLDGKGHPPKGFYGAGSDISAGTGATPSCLSLCRASTGEKVLDYRNAFIRPHEFAIFCVALCRLFRELDTEGAKLAWEHVGPGTTFGKTVWDTLNYRRVYSHTLDARFSRKTTDQPGWAPTPAAKLLLHTKYRQALLDRTYTNRSETALAETLNFKHDGNDSVEHTQYRSKENPTAGKANHGDIVVADALGCKMIEDFGRTVELQSDEEATARPGTVAWKWQEEEKAKARRGERYSNWAGRRR